MLIDKSHRIWMLLTIAATGLATWAYTVYAAAAPEGPRGGSWQGLLFGIAGSALMILAGLLAGRKKVPRWPIGTARFWLKAHIWLGLLSVPLILFHAGFHWGGLLERLLWIVLGLVILSGLAGVALQQYLPRQIQETTPREAMFEQIPHVCQALRETADRQVAKVCGSLFPPDDLAAEAPPDDGEDLRQFYVGSVRPFLAPGPAPPSQFMNPSLASAEFSRARQLRLPAAGRDVLIQLSAICDERRDLAKQARLHRWLHLWLLIHVPLSLTLLVLSTAHAIMSVYY